jgi:hypothetical protein
VGPTPTTSLDLNVALARFGVITEWHYLKGGSVEHELRNSWKTSRS